MSFLYFIEQQVWTLIYLLVNDSQRIPACIMLVVLGIWGIPGPVGSEFLFLDFGSPLFLKQTHFLFFLYFLSVSDLTATLERE